MLSNVTVVVGNLPRNPAQA